VIHVKQVSKLLIAIQALKYYILALSAGLLNLVLPGANVRKFQVRRASIDCGNAYSGFGGRGCWGRGGTRRGEDKGLLRLIGAQSASILPGKEVRLFMLDSILKRDGATCLGLLSFFQPLMNTHVYTSFASSVPNLRMKLFSLIQFRIICICYCR
jgi:hypothetical protein